MKKTLGFYSLAFLVSVVLVTGCSNPSAGAPGVPGVPGKPGVSGLSIVNGAITTTALQTLVNSGTPILIGGSTQVQGNIVDLKSADITVDALLSFTDCTVNAVNANITIGGGSITATNNCVILVPAVEPVWVRKITGSVTLAPLTSVEEFIRGNRVNNTLQSVHIDSTGKISGVDISAGLGGKKIYVIGELKNDYAGLNIPSDIIALGSVNSSANIKLGATTLSGDLTTTGSATLTVGRVTVGGNLSTGTGAVTTDGFFTVKGTTSIGSTFKFTNTVTFERDASFADDITWTGPGALNFRGNVTIAKGKKVNLPSVTLAKGKSINDALIAEAPVTLAPAPNATLTVDTVNGKKFTLGTAGCMLTKGRLIVSSGATLVVKENLTIAPETMLVTNGSVSVAATKALILSASGAGTGRIAGTGTVVAGKTAITGPWEAQGPNGTVTITNTSDNGATIAGTANLKASAAGAVITQTAGAGNVLTIGPTSTIALGGNSTTAIGSIVLKGAAANPGKLTFVGIKSGLITTDAASSTAITNVTKIAGNTGTGKGITGTFNNAVIGSVTGFKQLCAEALPNNITGGSTDTVLSGGAYTVGSFGN